jgi:hypothetical protein
MRSDDATRHGIVEFRETTRSRVRMYVYSILMIATAQEALNVLYLAQQYHLHTVIVKEILSVP